MKLYFWCCLVAFGFADWAVIASQVEAGKPMETPSSKYELEQAVGQLVTFRGIALDAKAGAVIKTPGGLVYIRKLSAWPPDLVGKEVMVQGKLIRKKIMPDPIPDESGITPQGAFGKHFVLENPVWQPVHER